MTPTDNPRMSSSLRRYADGNRTASRPRVEQLLHFIGADLAFADDVLGDLAEERVRRTARDGALFASWWYIGEAFRAAPHLAWNAILHGGQRGRAHVAAIVAAMALVLTAAVVGLRGGGPVAVRLEVDAQRTARTSDGVIVNSRYPALLAMRAFDAQGQVLKSTGVRYQWISGAPISVAANGIVTCSYAGDALLRASLDAVATTVRIKCLPVKEVLAHTWIHLVAGASSEELSFVALDPDGLPVNRLAGVLRVKDSTIATLHNGRIHPLSPGHTEVVMRFGEGEARSQVSVYERVGTFDGLRVDQRFVIAPVRLARGDTIRWPLPQGLFWLQYHAHPNTQPIPKLAVDGPIVCMPAFGPSVERVNCLARGAGASVRITYPGAASNVLLPPRVDGALSIEHEKYP
jgi:hypothetical protein